MQMMNLEGCQEQARKGPRGPIKRVESGLEGKGTIGKGPTAEVELEL